MGAHRLIKLAESKNDRDLVERVINRFYKVYFTDGKSIADKDVLTAAAVEAQQLGIQGAPFFVININMQSAVHNHMKYLYRR